MGRIELPPGTSEDVSILLEKARAGLPIADCATARNDLLCDYESFGEVEYVAPDGQGFRITGKFTVWVESDDVAYTFSYRPEASRELHEELERGEIEEDALPTDFVGKRLALRLEHGQPTVYIKGPVYADAEGAYAGLEIPFNAENEDAKDAYLIPVPLAQWHWERFIAYAPVQDCQVILVDYDEPPPELYVAQPAPSEASLWTPEAVLRGRSAGKAIMDRRGFIITDTIPAGPFEERPALDSDIEF